MNANDEYPRQIVSGGQTGVDRAALDVAAELGIVSGGWCPRGRFAEDGRIDDRYPLRETPSDEYAQRTEWNVRASDGTLVLLAGDAEGGTALTIEYCRRLGRECLVVDLVEADPRDISEWISKNRMATLNVAGPRESEAPGIYDQAHRFLMRLLDTRPRNAE